MIEPEPIGPEDIHNLEKQIRQLKEHMINEIEEIEDTVSSLKRRASYKLLNADQASEFIGVSKRQVWNLADNPKVQIWRYNKDGSRKTDNKKTPVRFNYIELSQYKERRERRRERNR